MYLSSTGGLYYVEGADTMEPSWRNIGPPFLDDAEPRTPDAEDLALFERTRVAYSIPE
jgi:hypothetical protein